MKKNNYTHDTYYIHDNGGKPFKVNVYKEEKVVQVYANTHDGLDNDSFSEEYVFRFNYAKIWVGEDPDHAAYLGNSILLQLPKGTYVSIGWKIYTFTTKDEIVEYHSPVGNSDVPYPYAVGAANAYMMVEEKMIRDWHGRNDWIIKNNLHGRDDPYIYYYSKTVKAEPFKFKLLHGRLW